MDEKVEVLLKEYDTLRAEILTAMASRHSIVTFGLATVGALWTAAATVLVAASEETHVLSYILLTFVSPLVSIFVVQMWLGEYGRMYRAGKFIADHSEPEINRLLKSDILTWESKLRGGKKHMRQPYYATVCLFVLSSLSSCVFGCYKMLADLSQCFVSISLIFVALLHFGLFVYFFLQLNRLRLE